MGHAPGCPRQLLVHIKRIGSLDLYPLPHLNPRPSVLLQHELHEHLSRVLLGYSVKTLNPTSDCVVLGRSAWCISLTDRTSKMLHMLARALGDGARMP